MSEIPEIPDDVMKHAAELARPIEEEHKYGFPEFHRVIALAILAERERAAKIAEDFFILPDTDTGPQIAAAIRKGR